MLKWPSAEAFLPALPLSTLGSHLGSLGHLHCLLHYQAGHPLTVCVQLYALFKIANGEDIKKSTAPGMFDLKVRRPRSELPYLSLSYFILLLSLPRTILLALELPC